METRSSNFINCFRLPLSSLVMLLLRKLWLKQMQLYRSNTSNSSSCVSDCPTLWVCLKFYVAWEASSEIDYVRKSPTSSFKNIIFMYQTGYFCMWIIRVRFLEIPAEFGWVFWRSNHVFIFCLLVIWGFFLWLDCKVMKETNISLMSSLGLGGGNVISQSSSWLERSVNKYVPYSFIASSQNSWFLDSAHDSHPRQTWPYELFH